MHQAPSQPSSKFSARGWRGWTALVCAAILLTSLVYWPGLHGPLLFDDYWNLTPIFKWQVGTVHWLMALLPNPDSVVFSRPVATASFMASVWLGGLESTFPLKLGNLLIHLACATAGGLLLRSLLRQDPNLHRVANPVSALLVAAWLLHPLHVSTVLYVVQRMAQLSTLFCLFALYAYVRGRNSLERGDMRRAIGLLFVAFPVLTVLGVLSKQNAAITPYLCLVVEVFYFSRWSHTRARPLLAFFGLFAFIPAVGAIILLAVAPERLLAAYADMEFGMLERLLTQPRALFDYIGMWFVPRSAEMGLYTDDFGVSKSLWQPYTTWLSIMALVGITIMAVAVRERAPSIPTGWCFFLVAHLVESSFLPLEMYYEHRNYLPSFGLLLATAGLLELVFRHRPLDHGKRRLAGMIAVLVIITLGASTLGRVLVWQNERSMVMQGLRHHPESIRLRIDGVALALREGDYEEAVRILEPMLTQQNPRSRWIGRLELQAVACAQAAPADPAQLKLAEAERFPEITVREVSVAMLFETVTRHRECDELSSRQIADTLAALLDATSGQPADANNKATFQRIVAQLYARGGDWARAEAHAAAVWSNTKSLSSGSVLTRAYIQNDKLDAAEEVIAELSTRVRPVETPWVREVEALRTQLKDARSGAHLPSPNRMEPEAPGTGLPGYSRLT